jgi:type IV pilus assembly protein PilN
MIRINLLPHREERRKRQNIQIAVLAGLTLGLAVLIVGAVHIAINGQIDYQIGRNNYLKKEIAVLDKQIEEIKRLKEQTQQLLARKKVVEALQVNRSDTVHVLDQLARRMPEGVYLKSVKQAGPKITLVGYAQSNARVSTLMRTLEDSPWVQNPTLVEIKAVTVDKQRMNEFSLNTSLRKQAAEAAPEKPGAAKPADAAKPGMPKAVQEAAKQAMQPKPAEQKK